MAAVQVEFGMKNCLLDQKSENEELYYKILAIELWIPESIVVPLTKFEGL
jgi:hypothetical protein